jgi:hypothetical protein
VCLQKEEKRTQESAPAPPASGVYERVRRSSNAGVRASVTGERASFKAGDLLPSTPHPLCLLVPNHLVTDTVPVTNLVVVIAQPSYLTLLVSPFLSHPSYLTLLISPFSSHPSYLTLLISPFLSHPSCLTLLISPFLSHPSYLTLLDSPFLSHPSCLTLLVSPFLSHPSCLTHVLTV